MKICMAGQGAFGQKHLDALKRIPGVEVTSLVGGSAASTAEVAKKYGIAHHTQDLAEGIELAAQFDAKARLEANHAHRLLGRIRRTVGARLARERAACRRRRVRRRGVGHEGTSGPAGRASARR